MAHNAYYPPPTPLGQQPPIHPQPGSSPGGHQYAQHPQQQYYQQPQNIYQQLGQAQPQPHLQRLYQQQQGQYTQQPATPAQPAGYGQQQSHGFVQRPLSTSFQPPQHAYAPATTPFQQPPPAQQQPYPPSQQYVTNQYTSSTLQQPPRPPISRTPSAQGFVQPNTYAGQGYMAPAPQQQELNPPVMASMVSQQMQRRSPQPPPPAPSALLAQQTRLQRQPSQAPSTTSQGHPQPVQMQMRQQPPAAPQNHVMQMQQRQPPQMPPPRQQQQLQHSQFSQQRRPLPQPSGDDPNPPPSGLVRSGTVASRPLSMPPTLAPISTSHSMFNREPSPQPTLGQPMSASSIPPPSFVQRQIQQIQAMQAQKQHAEGMVGSSSSSGPIGPQSSSSGSPVKSRPLPAAPGSQAKRATVDLGRVSGLPNVNNGSGFAFSSSPNATSNGLSGSTSGSEELSSSRKGFPTASSGGTSRTTVMAALDNDSTPTKRASGRASPPKFASSTSSSPAKEEAKSPWSNSSPSKPSNVFGGPKNISTPDLSASSLGKHPVSPGSTSTATTPTKKFTPVWKRTIPDYPAPVFGYAAGMVADPFAKPNASSTSVSSSPSKLNETPKATKVLTEKERKKLDKEEKKKAKEEEKQRKKMVKRGIAVPPTTGNASAAATPVRQPAGVSANKPSPSQLPYLNPTPPRVGAPGEYSKAYAHGQLQHQHLMARGAAVGYGQGQQTSSQQSTPTRQIQVRGQPVQASASGTSPSAATRYSMPLAKQESSTEEDEEAEDDDEDESDQDVEQAYQYEGSDYSEETSEQEYAVPMSRKAREQKQREEEERQYQEYLAQQQRAKEKAKKSGGSSPGRYQDGYERPSPTSRHGHVKSRSSASDGFVVVSQSQPSGRNGPRPAHSRTQSYHTNYSNSEDDWEQLQSYEASPEQFKATPTPKARAKGKGRRYQEPSEEEDGGGEEEEEEAESAEEELRRRYMAKRKRERAQAKAQAEAEAQKQAQAEAQAREQARGSRHRREASERETVRKFQREPEYEYESDPRVHNSTAKQSMQGRGMREKVQDIDWGRQEQPQDRNAPRKYQQQLKYDGDDDDGRGREKTKVKRRASLKELFSSRSKSRSRHAEPEEEEEDYSRQKASSSPTKKPSQPTRKLVKKGSRKVMANSETESNDDDSVATEESTTKTLASRFASVMKLSGGQPQRPQQPQHQKTPSQTQSQSQAKRQSGFSPGGSGSLYFGILDEPDTPASASPASAKANSVMSNRAPSRVRGEVNRSKIGLKVDNLDDPPPRSLRTPSPSPSGPPKRQSMYQYPTGTDQRPPQSRQIDSQQRPRPQSQIYPATAKSSFMDDVPHNQQGSGSEILQPKRRELPQQPPQHPQSQSRSRPQSQNFQQQQNPMTFDAATGLPVHHQQAMQGYAPPPQRQLSRAPSQRQLYNNSNNDARSVPSVPSTPRQQQPINIESPAPLKMANILKMEEDGAAQERRQEEFQQRFSPQNLPSINLHHTGQQQFQGQHPSINVQHTGNHQNQQPYQNQPNAPLINVGSPPDSTASSPRIGVHHTGRTDMTNGTHQMIPIINFDTMPSSPPANPGMPSINISEAPPSPTTGNGRPPPQIFEVPGISVSGQFDDGPSNGAPQISVSASGDNGHNHNHNHGPQSHQHPHPHQPQQARFVNGRPTPARSGTGGLICGGCQGPIVGRIVSAMGVRWHPNCFKCSVCSELLEHVSSYEHDGRPYCHLDYHENFAPRCYSCKTPIIEEQFISLDDPALGKRTYHMEHFFCAECGDPFLTPSMSNTSGELALSGDGDFEGFTVYKGHPYCEPCHVRLRLPKCKKCKKSIRDHDRAVEALGGKWCWTCFVCEGCNQPFDDPSFFQRDGHPYCEHCFSIILRNEM